MKETRARLIEKIKRTDTVQSFRLHPDERIDFVPGQFLQIVFDEQNRGNKALNKYLSFSSSPSRTYIEVTKRLSNSDFSRKLQSLDIDDEILLRAPFGACVFKEEYEKIGFLIGGIGITPVISILEHIIDHKLNTDVVLFYSNRTEKEIAFKRELDLWQSSHSNIKIFYTVTDCPPEDSTCILGPIEKRLISTNIHDVNERVLFTFGPPGMVEVMKSLCSDLGCSQTKVKTETFIGY